MAPMLASTPTPIHRLCPELLAQIFFYTSLTPPYSYPVFSPAAFPILSTLVCRRWKDVALAFPFLWSSLKIGLKIDGAQLGGSDGASYEERLRGRGRAIIRWLESARNCKVSLLVFMQQTGFECVPCSEKQRFLEEVMEPFISELCSSRFTRNWRSLAVCVAMDEPYRSRFLQIPAVNLPSLVSLNFSAGIRDCSLKKAPWVVKLLGTLPDKGLLAAPNVTKLGLSPLHCEREQHLEDHIPWSNITDLTLYPRFDWSEDYQLSFHHYFTFVQVLQILIPCRSTLTSLNFRIPSSYVFEPLNLNINPSIVVDLLKTLGCDIFEMPQLTRLTMKDESVSHSFVSSMRTPRLEYLAYQRSSLLGKDVYPESHPDSPFASFVKSNCANFSNLTELHFNYDDLQPGELEVVFEILGGPGTQVKILCVKTRSPCWTVATEDDEDDGVGLDCLVLEGAPGSAVFSEPILRRFSPNPDTARKGLCLFPKLERFEFWTGWKQDFGDRAFLEFLHARILASRSQPSTVSKLIAAKAYLASDRTIDVVQELEDRLGKDSVGRGIGVLYVKERGEEEEDFGDTLHITDPDFV